MIIDPHDYTTATRESLLKILELLVDEGFLKNNCELVISSPFISRLLGSQYLHVIYSMNNLRKLDIVEYEVTFADLAHLFQSCPNIIHLHLKLFRQDLWDIKDDLSLNQLILGFQKLQLLEVAGHFLHSGNKMVLEILPSA